ncbi:MAG: RCC1-like domain-containing protein [Candidatus Roizmanbacteria bacterium]
MITEKIVQVSCGNNHSLLLSIDGNVYATGAND